MKNNIVRDYKLKLSFLKKEYKRILYNSIIQSRLTKRMTKAIIRYNMSTWHKKYRISAQKRTCLILGKNRSVYPKLNLKRHTIKKMNATCLITGLNMGKW